VSEPWILASTSPYRRALLDSAGLPVEVVAPDFDERTLDDRFAAWGVERYVVEVARGKARSVARTAPPGSVVVGADQVAVHDGRMLTKPGTVPRAVAQLLELSGGSHELVNGVVAMVAPDGPERSLVDRHVVRMRRFTEAEARAYVERCRPLDCVGAYRIEDDADFLAEVDGSGRDGVIGLPVQLVVALVAALRADGTAAGGR